MDEENKNITPPGSPEVESPETPIEDNVPEPEETTASETESVADSTPEPSDPAAEVTETPEPATPAPDPNIIIVEPAPELSTEPEKKPKKGLIIALVTIIVLLLVAVVTVLVLNYLPKSDPQTSQEPVDEVKPLEKSELRLSGNELNDFDLAFLTLEENENIIYSPLSLKYALAMLKDASAGNSKAQIEAVIGDYQPKAYLNSKNRSLANAMFINTDYEQNILPSYTNLLLEKYFAEVKTDPFNSPDNVNSWISDKTLGIINNMLTKAVVSNETKFLLINALAIDMEWNNQLQCDYDGRNLPCKYYDVKYSHEKYSEYISDAGLSKKSFNGGEEKDVAKIGASINRYDIFGDLGEDKIRETVTDEYKKWVAKIQADEDYKAYPDNYDLDFNIEAYLSELRENYGQTAESTDFYFADTEAEKVFAKDLKEYDGSTLEYVGIMPKTESLTDYLKSFNAKKASSLIESVKNTSVENFEDGIITKITGTIPFFKFNYDFELFDPLTSLGITDVFNPETADLSGMIKDIDLETENRPFIDIALHKADIDFSNDGIKAAAVTIAGGKGAAGPASFDYFWDVPVKEIDLTFDQPFLFLIRDKKTGEVWFAGSVYEI